MKNTLIVCVFFLGSLLSAAPAPIPLPDRHFTRNEIIGEWTYLFGGFTKGNIKFFKDGSYFATIGDNEYIGKWTVNNESHIMIKERSYNMDHFTFEKTLSAQESEFVFKFRPTKTRVGKIKKLEGVSWNTSPLGIPIILEK